MTFIIKREAELPRLLSSITRLGQDILNNPTQLFQMGSHPGSFLHTPIAEYPKAKGRVLLTETAETPI